MPDFVENQPGHEGENKSVEIASVSSGVVIPTSPQIPPPPEGATSVEGGAVFSVSAGGDDEDDYTVPAAKNLIIQTIIFSTHNANAAYASLILNPGGGESTIIVARNTGSLPVNETFPTGSIIRSFVNNTGGGTRQLMMKWYGYLEDDS